MKDLLSVIRDEFQALRHSAPPVEQRQLSPDWQSWLKGSDTIVSGIEATVRQPYAQHTAIFRGINVVATAIMQFELEVFDGEDENDTPEDGHWLPELMDKPDELRRSGQLIKAIVIQYKLRGEAFLWHKDIRRGSVDSVRRPHEAWFLDPRMMMPDTTQDGQHVRGWFWSSPMGSQYIPLEELTFFRDENPYDPVRGFGEIQSALMEYTGDYRAALWNRAFFDNAAIPPIVFKVADPKAGMNSWPAPDREAFISSWEQKLQGAGRRGKTAALPGGIDLEVLKLTQQEMDFLAGRRYHRENILSVQGVPPGKAGILEYANYANMGPQDKQFHFDTVVPLAEYLAAVLSADLLGRYEPGKICEFKTGPKTAQVMAEDYQRKIALAKDLWSMGVPFEEINERLELDISTIGMPWLSEGWLPINVIPATQASEPPPPPPPPAPVVLPPTSPDGDTPADEPKPEDVPPPQQEEAARRSWPTAPKARAALWRGYERKAAIHERRFLGDWRRFLTWLRDETIARITAPRAIRTVDEFLPHAEAVAKKAQSATASVVRSAAHDGWIEIVSEAGFEAAVDFNYLDPQVVNLLSQRMQSIKGASETVAARLREQIAEGLTKGESPQELAKRVGSWMKEQYTGQATTVARTESMSAYSGGRDLSMKANGITRHEWLSARDANVRESHVACDGIVVTIGDTYPNGLTRPHQDGAPAAEVCNCRCIDLPVLEEEEP